MTTDIRSWWFLDTLVVQHPMASTPGPVVLEVTLPLGASPPLHTHQDGDDSWYLLDGRMVLRSHPGGDPEDMAGAKTWLAGPGEWVSVPPGVPHTFRVVGDRPARILSVFADDGFLRLVRTLGVPAGNGARPEPTGGPDLAELTRVMAAHDITVVGPPMEPPEADVLA